MTLNFIIFLMLFSSFIDFSLHNVKDNKFEGLSLKTSGKIHWVYTESGSRRMSLRHPLAELVPVDQMPALHSWS